MNAADEVDLDSASIADLLKFFRKRAGLSQAELAKSAGVSDGMVGNVERGTRNVGRDTADAIARVLDLSDADRDALLAARQRYGATGPINNHEDWNDLKSSLSEEDRAVIRSMIEALRRKR